MIKMLFGVETRHRRPGRLRWQPWRINVYDNVTDCIKWARLKAKREQEGPGSAGWEFQARVVAFDRRKR